MKILVLGCNGQLGKCLYEQFKNTNYEVVYTSREKLDISNFSATKHKICEIAPNIVINASAYTEVDRAEDEKNTANLINNLAVGNLAHICSKLDNWLIHISTDYVFDGTSKTPYKEDYRTNPQSIYGETKLKGEQAIQFSGCNHIIIRTAWLFSEYGNNFLTTMVRLGEKKQELSIIDDQIGSPTYAHDLANVILNVIEKLRDKKVKSNLYHYCGFASCSWYEFANYIFDQADRLNFKTPKKLIKISSISYKTNVKRPNYSVLNCSKIEKFVDSKTSDWKHGVKKSLIALKND